MNERQKEYFPNGTLIDEWLYQANAPTLKKFNLKNLLIKTYFVGSQFDVVDEVVVENVTVNLAKD